MLLPEDEAGELVAGRLEEEEVPDAVHELSVACSSEFWVPGSASGVCFGSELKTLTGAVSGRKADVSVFLPGRAAPPRRGAIREPADGNYVKIVGATAGRVDPIPGCEGLVIDLDALWLELGRLSHE